MSWPTDGQQDSLQRINVRPLRTRTEKDELNSPLEGPVGRTKQLLG